MINSKEVKFDGRLGTITNECLLLGLPLPYSEGSSHSVYVTVLMVAFRVDVHNCVYRNSYMKARMELLSYITMNEKDKQSFSRITPTANTE